jgi:hypothetical protein
VHAHLQQQQQHQKKANSIPSKYKYSTHAVYSLSVEFITSV